MVLIFPSSEESLVLARDGQVIHGAVATGSFQPPADLGPLIDLDVHFDVAIGLRPDGTVVTWGPRGENGGDLAPPEGLDQVVAVACGMEIALALRSDGTVVQWGSGVTGSPPPAVADVVAIDVGDMHAIAQRSDHTAISWFGDGTPMASFSSLIDIIENSAILSSCKIYR